MSEELHKCGHTNYQHDVLGYGRRDLCEGYSDIELEAKAREEAQEPSTEGFACPFKDCDKEPYKTERWLLEHIEKVHKE